MRRKTIHFALLIGLLSVTLAPINAHASLDPIVRTWEYKGGEINVTEANGTFTGVVTKAIAFSKCVHEVGQMIWVVTKKSGTTNGYFGSFVGFFEDCTSAPEIISLLINSTAEASTLKICPQEAECLTLNGGPVPSADTGAPVVIIKDPVSPLRLGQSLTMEYSVKDESNEAYVTTRFYSEGSILFEGKAPYQVEAVGNFIKAEYGAYGGMGIPAKTKGPYYFCVFAEDVDGNTSGEFSNCKWLSVEVPIAYASNGCGGAATKFDNVNTAILFAFNLLLNKRTYIDKNTRGKYTVNFAPACNNHDAGYSGVTIKDQISGRVTDFRTSTRAKVDTKFKSDIAKLCSFAIPKSASDALRQCQVGSTLPKPSVLVKELMTLAVSVDSFKIGMWEVYKRLNRYVVGATAYWQMVHEFGKTLYDADSTEPGEQPSIPSVTSPAGGARDHR
ncbi:MAG: hypothetical protein WA090_05460 [Candidatus Nanopelagicaceae bacterium]